MEINKLNMAVTLALHYTDRVKALSKEDSRKIRAVEMEFHYYQLSTRHLYELYCDLIDPHTAKKFHGREIETAEKWVYSVECMIYRLQQMYFIAQDQRAAEIRDMLSCLQQISKHLLPLAVPGNCSSLWGVTPPPSTIAEHWGIAALAVTELSISFLLNFFIIP